MDVSILKNLFTNEREQLIYSKINEIFKKYFLKAIEIYNSNCLISKRFFQFNLFGNIKCKLVAFLICSGLLSAI